MSAANLLMDLNRRGIQLEADGDRLRYHPRSAVTPDLAVQLKANKPALLAAVRGDPGAAVRLLDAAELWRAALDRLEADPGFGPEEMVVLRAAEAHWEPSQP